MTNRKGAANSMDTNSLEAPAAPVRSTAMTAVTVFYAVMPAIVCVVWFATLGLGSMMEHGQLRMIPFFQGLVLIAAMATGLNRSFFAGMMTRGELVALVVFVGVFLYTALFVAVSPDDALTGGLARGLFPVTGICLVFLLNRYPRDRIDGVSLALIAQPLVHFPFLIALYIAYVDIPTMNWLGGPIGFWHVRIWSMTLAAAAAVVFGLYLAREEKGWRPHIVTFVLLLLLSTALAWSGSRASVLGLLCGLVFTVLLFPRRGISALPVTALAMIAGAALSLLLKTPIEAYGLLNGLIESTQGADLNEASAGRMGMWRDAMGLIAERPLFGYGHDQYQHVYTFGFFEAIQPHNTLISFLFDFGLVGGGALIFLILSLWWRGYRRIVTQAHSWKIGAFTALTAMAVISLFDGVLYHEAPMMIVAMCFAVLFANPPRATAP